MPPGPDRPDSALSADARCTESALPQHRAAVSQFGTAGHFPSPRSGLDFGTSFSVALLILWASVATRVIHHQRNEPNRLDEPDVPRDPATSSALPCSVGRLAIDARLHPEYSARSIMKTRADCVRFAEPASRAAERAPPCREGHQC